MGPVQNPEYNSLKDAKWNERLASGVLITGIVLMGIAPFLINKLITPSTKQFMIRIQNILP
jgi:NADH-quinone oxidoreductase subunit M